MTSTSFSSPGGRLAAALLLAGAAALASPAAAEIRMDDHVRFAESSGVSDSVRQECGLQTLLPELVEAAGPDVVRVSGVPREGRVLVLSIREVHAPGGGPFSGPKWMVVEAELHEQGKLVATARAKRMTTGPFGGTCAHLQKVARAIAVDLGAWLRDPRRGAELGDR